jgi:Ferritin-like
MQSSQLRIVPQSQSKSAAWSAAAPAVTIEPLPGWNSRQFVIFLLQTAADIEHALLIQYLYAAYSLPQGVSIKDPKTGNDVVDPDTGQKVTTNNWSSKIAGVAQEEMGHLMSIQCLLRALGGPIGLDREHFPYRSELYPFPFTLEPLTKRSLARYVVAEMPDPSLVPTGVLTPEQIKQIQELATRDTGGVPINHVGMLYDKLIEVVGMLDESDFRQDAIPYQVIALDKWEADEKDNDTGIKVLPIRPLPDGSVTKLKDVALRALGIIARQGEGRTTTTMANQPKAAKDNSHFHRFVSIFKTFPDGLDPALPVATNPNTSVPLPPPLNQASDQEADLEEQRNRPGRIINSTTSLWASLFNVRYRILLAELHHYLLLRNDDADQLAVRDRLRVWAISEMDGRKSAIRNLARMLSTLPQYNFSGFNAGAPFEVPFTFDLPDRGPDRWSFHKDLYEGSRDLVKTLSAALKAAGLPGQDVLDNLTMFEDTDDGYGDKPAIGRKDFIEKHKDSVF